jgi:hypothetical protein
MDKPDLFGVSDERGLPFATYSLQKALIFLHASRRDDADHHIANNLGNFKEDNW